MSFSASSHISVLRLFRPSGRKTPKPKKFAK